MQLQSLGLATEKQAFCHDWCGGGLSDLGHRSKWTLDCRIE